jgi:prolyl 4-hydroxylase
VFQIVNYGIGGVYTHHTDADGDNGLTFGEQERRGDRLATFIGYLSDVDAGGATAFPAMGVTLWPKKGDAAYW